MSDNQDARTVAGFGDEWSRFDQSTLTDAELDELFDRYFSIFPWNMLPETAVGFDLGCGSGRWARRVAPRVGRLLCLDASREALSVARATLSAEKNCEFVHASVGDLPIDDGTMDFGYSLGVLHHVPDTAAAIKECSTKLKSGAPFLLYIYYAFDNRPAWFRLLWRMSDFLRKLISCLPMRPRYYASQLIAFCIYLPLARSALVLEKVGMNVDAMPLSAYRNVSFYTMRTDALDRFGTRLEQRFTAKQVKSMMQEAGFEQIEFSPSIPYWCALGIKG